MERIILTLAPLTRILWQLYFEKNSALLDVLDISWDILRVENFLSMHKALVWIPSPTVNEWIEQTSKQLTSCSVVFEAFRCTASEVTCCGAWRLCCLWEGSSVEEEPAKHLHTHGLPSVFSLCSSYSTWLCLCRQEPDLLALVSLRKASTSAAPAGRPLKRGLGTGR